MKSYVVIVIVYEYMQVPTYLKSHTISHKTNDYTPSLPGIIASICASFVCTPVECSSAKQ